MLEHHAQLANEIKQAYMNTMRWYYSHHFDRFKRALEKVKVDAKIELIGTDDSRRNGIFSTGRPGVGNDPFHIGDRIDILKEGSDLVALQAKDLDRQVSRPCFWLLTVVSTRGAVSELQSDAH
jgi:Vps52 / Sac2 family